MFSGAGERRNIMADTDNWAHFLNSDNGESIYLLKRCRVGLVIYKVCLIINVFIQEKNLNSRCLKHQPVSWQCQNIDSHSGLNDTLVEPFYKEFTN